jgi:hypothetical protein
VVGSVVRKFALAGVVLVLGLAAANPAIAGPRKRDCVNCPPRKYDEQTVIKKVREIDHSRVINTVTVVPVRRRVREINRLVVHENETRHVGTVQHNHTIIEKEIHYVRRIPIETTVNFVTHRYRVVEWPNSILVPATRRVRTCSHGRPYGSCGPLRVRG